MEQDAVKFWSDSMKSKKITSLSVRSRFSQKEKAVTSRRRSRLFKWFGSGFGSIFIHVIIILLLFLIVRGESRRAGSNIRQTDEIGVVFSDPNDSSTQDSPASAETATLESSSSESTSFLEASDTLHDALDNFLPTNEIGTTDSSDGATAREVINSVASGRMSEGEGKQTGQSIGFSGARAVGRKFVYVIDRSDSMRWNGGSPMRKAISDAVSSVQSLDVKEGASKFQVLVFNHEVNVFDSGTGLIDVNPANKAKCVHFLKSLVPSGGTSPEQALATGIRMRPDTIFFLTDADEELTDQALERIQTLRRQCKVQQICVIEFRKSTDPVKKTYRRLAGENGGSYVVRNVDLF